MSDPLTSDPLTSDPLSSDPLTRDPLSSDPLGSALALVGRDQLGAIAAGVAEGRVVELRSELRAHPEWLLDSQPPDQPGGFKLWQVGGDRVIHGRRAELLALLGDRLRYALAPWEGRGDVPPWVDSCRLAQVAMMALESCNE